MVGPAKGSAFDQLMKQPDQIGGAETQICYLFVDDADAHRDRAKAAGAEILLDIDGERRRGRGYSCRDPEGHIWNFGTYNPWQALEKVRRSQRSKHRTLLLGASLMLLAALAAGLLFGLPEQVLAEREAARAPWTEQQTPGSDEIEKQLAKLQGAKEAAESALRTVREQLIAERAARETADRSLKSAQEQLAKQQATVSAPAPVGVEARGELERERTSRIAAESAAAALRAQLAETQEAKLSAERAAQDMRDQLATAQAAKATIERRVAERTAKEVRERVAKEIAAKEAAELKTRLEANRAARIAARARIKRLREANAPAINPPLPAY
jgi:hypothetical protein